jgi:hypothetical protein
MAVVRSECLHLTFLCQSAIASVPSKNIQNLNYIDMHIACTIAVMWTVGFDTFAAVSCKIACVNIIICHLFVCPSLHM